MNAAQMNTVEAIIIKHTSITDLTSRRRGLDGEAPVGRRYWSRSYLLLNKALRNELHDAGFKTFIAVNACHKYSIEIFPPLAANPAS